MAEQQADKRNGAGLNTFAGVFTPSILTILGIILFLRAGYVVGSAGFGRVLVIIGLANLISVLTSVSLSAVATNLKVKGGGDYYLISRTLGLEFGGAIGIVLFLAQAVSIAFYCIGFGEVVVALDVLPAGIASPRIVAAAAVALLFIFAWLGADWATRFQYVVMVLLSVALASFFVGGIMRWDSAVFVANWAAPAGGPGFWVLFALFFPAVTGFTQGVSMSGDLANPGRSLPFGTLLAVGVSMVVYFGAAIVFAGVLPNADLTADYSAMNRIAMIPRLIIIGVIAATLSSAMASFLGAPRILQALAADRIFPVLSYFAHGVGPADNPRRAVLLAAGIACLTIVLGNLNLIAPVVSMFFLISYGLLNYATYYEASTASPSFRPTFKLFDRRLSLFGALACLGVMLAIDPSTGIVAIAILFAVYQYLRRTADPARWADSRRAYYLQRIREHLQAVGGSPEHPRDWRPQILAFSEDAERRPRLLQLAGWLEGGSGMTTVVTLLEGKDRLLSKKKEEVEKLLQQDINEYNPTAFPLVLVSRDIEIGVHVLLQAHGIGPLRANTILLNWLDPDNEAGAELRALLFGRQLRTLFQLGCNIVILFARPDAWRHLTEIEAEDACIDVWWTHDATGNLMLLFAYLLTRSGAWRKGRLRVLAFADILPEPVREESLSEILSEARIEAEIIFVEKRDAAALVEQSLESTLVFLPFRFSGNLMEMPVDGPVEELLGRLPPTVMVSGAEDIDLGAEPEEGAAAQLATARDLVEKKEKLAEELEERVADMQRTLVEAEENLRRILAQPDDDRDGAAMAKVTAARDEAVHRLEVASRRAIRARIKADQAQEDLAESQLSSRSEGGEDPGHHDA